MDERSLSSNSSFSILTTESVKQKKAVSGIEIRRLKLLWQEGLYEASLQHGALRITHNKVLKIDPVLYTFKLTFGISLMSLRLIGVQLEEFPEEIAEHLFELQIISLENNRIAHVPDNLCSLTQLRELYLSHNLISQLPQRIGFLCSLQHLAVNNNRLKDLPQTFGALNLLTRVDLECNELTVLPENLEHMASCEVLIVNRNRLIRLPRCLGRMPSLTHFSASNNKIPYLPQELFASKTVSIIRLGMNQISSLPERVGDLGFTLTELCLDYNDLQRLPLSFYKLSKLKILRVEGNKSLLSPPSEILNAGAVAVVGHCREQFLGNKEGRMKHIILATQSALRQATEQKLYNPALFEPNVTLLALRTRYGQNHISNKKLAGQDPVAYAMDLDEWTALQPSHFFDELLPKLRAMWAALQATNSRHSLQAFKDEVTEFTFSEKEVMWAFINYRDALGPVLKREKALFRRCACLEPDVPPAVGFMCCRDATLLKMRIVRERDRTDRLWQAYKATTELDAIRRAEAEAEVYLNSRSGQLWVKETALEQADSAILDQAADEVVARRIASTEQRQQKILRKFERRQAAVGRRRAAKLAVLQPQLDKLKETNKLAREGYLKMVLERKIDALVREIATLPETVELENLQHECERQVEAEESALYASSSSDDADLFSSSSDSDNVSDAFDSDDSSPEADRWRHRRHRRQERRKDKERLEAARKRARPDASTLHQVADTIHTAVDHGIMRPLVDPMRRRGRRLLRKLDKQRRDIVEVSIMRTRRAMRKLDGNFDEAQIELRYEIARQFKDNAVRDAIAKVRREFSVIEGVRRKMEGVGREMAFIAWKKWVWEKQRRERRDIREAFKQATKGFAASIESLRSAQLQAAMWVQGQDIYSDRIYYQHMRSGAITYDIKPGPQHYLPPHFKLPQRPEALPEDVALASSSSSSSDGGDLMKWQQKYGMRRAALASRENQRAKRMEVQKRRMMLTKGDEQAAQEYALQDDSLMIMPNSDGEIDNNSSSVFRDSESKGSLPRSLSQRTMSQQQLISRQASRQSLQSQGSFILPPIGSSASSGKPAPTTTALTLDFNADLDAAIQELLPELTRLLTVEQQQMILPNQFDVRTPAEQHESMWSAQQSLAVKANTEYELAYKHIRRKRNALNPTRHELYMSHNNRKPRSHEQIKEAASAPQLLELEPGVTIDISKITNFADPSPNELLQLAGGTIDMIHTGKAGVELRTVLAQRALHIKEKLQEQAVMRGELSPDVLNRKRTFYNRELKPLFMHKFDGSSSDEEAEGNEQKRMNRLEARKAHRRQRKDDRRKDREYQERVQEKEENRRRDEQVLLGLSPGVKGDKKNEV